MHLQDELSKIDEKFVQFLAHVQKINSWMDKTLDALDDASLLPNEQKNSDEERQKFKVGRDFISVPLVDRVTVLPR